MASFEQGHIVRVPFPYTDRSLRQFRPALVVSNGAIGAENRLLWVVMITSAENRGWPGDQDIAAGFDQTGLPQASIVRPSKIATIETRDAEPIGKLSAPVMARVADELRRSLKL